MNMMHNLKVLLKILNNTYRRKMHFYNKFLDMKLLKKKTFLGNLNIELELHFYMLVKKINTNK